MKITNETKVGVLTIVSLTLLILGFNFLKGKDLFKKSRRIYAVFNDLGSLSKSNEVKINGYVIGSVYEIKTKDKDMSGIVATISLTEDVNIPTDSKALISTPLVGASYIIIEKGEQTVYLKNGDTLTTRVDVGILDDVKAQLTPTLTKVRNTLDTLNQVLNNVNSVLNTGLKQDLQQTLSNFNRASASLKTLIDDQTSSLSRTLRNAEEITEDLKGNTEDIRETVSNARKASEKLAALDLQSSIQEINQSIAQFKGLLTKIDNKDGTLGALIHDRTLYNNLKNATLGLEILLDDIRAHPKRYVHLSVFGRKERGGALTAPLPKDTVK